MCTHHNWVDLIKSPRVRNPFRVIETATDYMKDLRAIEKRFVKKKKCDDGSMMMMRTLSAVRVVREHPGKLFFKTIYSRDMDVWGCINTRRRVRAGAAPEPLVDHTTLLPKFPRGRAIEAARKADLVRVTRRMWSTL